MANIIIVDTEAEISFLVKDDRVASGIIGVSLLKFQGWFKDGKTYRIFDRFIVTKKCYLVKSRRGGTRSTTLKKKK